MATNDFTASSTILDGLAKFGDVEKQDLSGLIDEYCISMEVFFDLAMREIESHNSTDFDGLEFLVEAAKTKLLNFGGSVYAMRESATTEDLPPRNNATADELAKQFPCNAEPFAAWYSLDPVNGRGCWAVNNEAGEAVYETPSHEAAVKLSRALTPKPEKFAVVLALDDKAELPDVQAALPDSPPKEFANKAEPVSICTRSLIGASDKLREAAYLAEFIQSISLIVSSDKAILLQPGQVTGFYYAMSDTIDRIKAAETLIDTARKQPEALPA